MSGERLTYSLGLRWTGSKGCPHCSGCRTSTTDSKPWDGGWDDARTGNRPTSRVTSRTRHAIPDPRSLFCAQTRNPRSSRRWLTSGTRETFGWSTCRTQHVGLTTTWLWTYLALDYWSSHSGPLVCANIRYGTWQNGTWSKKIRHTKGRTKKKPWNL